MLGLKLNHVSKRGHRNYVHDSHIVVLCCGLVSFNVTSLTLWVITWLNTNMETNHKSTKSHNKTTAKQSPSNPSAYACKDYPGYFKPALEIYSTRHCSNHSNVITMSDFRCKILLYIGLFAVVDRLSLFSAEGELEQQRTRLHEQSIKIC